MAKFIIYVGQLCKEVLVPVWFSNTVFNGIGVNFVHHLVLVCLIFWIESNLNIATNETRDKVWQINRFIYNVLKFVSTAKDLYVYETLMSSKLTFGLS